MGDFGYQAFGNHPRGVGDLPGAETAQYDHIGSTSVPGLAAKASIDLQVRILPLPSDEQLRSRLGLFGYVRATGSRPDSPGVYRDISRGSDDVDVDVWAKSLFVHPDENVILHVRRSDSPWGRYTVAFRDLLRADSMVRARYEEVKIRLSSENEGKPDYDDYTLAKTDFFDALQPQIELWMRP